MRTNGERFPLTSEQLELLIAFEATGSLSRLAEVLARDPSVISRNLQKLAESAPVLEKQSGKWRMTPMGREINLLTKRYLTELQALLPPPNSPKPTLSSSALLVVINGQKGLRTPGAHERNNDSAEANILQLLNAWRKSGKSLVHVPHISGNPESIFHRHSPGAAFIEVLAPLRGETVIEKTKASAFDGTMLELFVETKGVDTLVLTGFTAAECIDATAKQANALGWDVVVASDATATFDIVGHDGKLHPAERIHALVLANLHALACAKIMSTREIMGTC